MKRHPAEMEAPEVEAFLTHLAVQGKVARPRRTRRSTRSCSCTGYDIRTVQELLVHKDVPTTMIYTHVLNRGGRGVRNPLDGVGV